MLQFTSPSNYLRCFLLLSFYSPQHLLYLFTTHRITFPRKSCNISNTKLGFFLPPKEYLYVVGSIRHIFRFLFFFVFYRYCSEVTNLKYLQTQENENLKNTFILFAFQFVSFVHFIIFSKNRPSSESHLSTPPTFSRDIMCER